jgi:hypothetical protein
MGFKEIKRAVLAALANGNYQHAARGSIDTKNLLQTGFVTAAEVSDVIRRCRGQHHRESPHHQVAGLAVHVLSRDGWYIKFYLVADGAMFISVHR